MFEIRTDPAITTGSDGETVTVDDIRSIHGFPDPSADGAPTGDGVTVAVMDSGIDESHEVFDDVTVEHHNFTSAPDRPYDQVGHGTAVAGLIAQLSPGIDRLVDLRIFGTSGRASGQSIFAAYAWALDHAEQLTTINCSWGARTDVPAIDEAHMQLVNAGVQDAVAAGNTGTDGGSPATARDAYGVGAMTADKTVTRFSSYNDGPVENPDLVALGKDVRLPRAEGTSMGTVLDDDYVKASGTSFSSPIATAAMNLLLETDTTATERWFERSARDIPGTPEDVHGYLWYEAADEPPAETSPVAVFDLPVVDADGILLPANWVDQPHRAVLERDTDTETVVRFER